MLVGAIVHTLDFQKGKVFSDFSHKPETNINRIDSTGNTISAVSESMATELINEQINDTERQMDGTDRSSLPVESQERSPLAEFLHNQSSISAEEESAYIEAHHNEIEQHVVRCMGSLGLDYEPEPFYMDDALIDEPTDLSNKNNIFNADYILGSKPGYGYYESVEFALYINAPPELITEYDSRAPNAMHLQAMDEQMQGRWFQNMVACNDEAFDINGEFDSIFQQSQNFQALPDKLDWNTQLDLIKTRIDNHPLATAALSAWSYCMANSGFKFENEESIHDELDNRLRVFDTALSDGVTELTPNLQQKLQDLTTYEVAIRKADLNCRPPLDDVLTSVRWEVETEFMTEIGLR